jgi:ubiquitin-protein ligase
LSAQTPILPAEQFFERLAVEFSMMMNEEPNFHCPNDDLTRYRGVILGTGPYEGGFFKVEIVIPREFPYNPPKILWHTRVWHPNISSDNQARVCDSILNRDWTPSLHVFTIIETLRVLLAYPNPDDPLNQEAARQLKTEPIKFQNTVQRYLQEYATPEQAFW